jgi:hypothetical protein
MITSSPFRASPNRKSLATIANHLVFEADARIVQT